MCLTLSSCAFRFALAIATLALVLLQGCSHRDGAGLRSASRPDSCSAPMVGVDCAGEELLRRGAASARDCCDLCSATSGCGAYALERTAACPTLLECPLGAAGACYPMMGGDHACFEDQDFNSSACPAQFVRCAFSQPGTAYIDAGVCVLKSSCDSLKLDDRIVAGTPYIIKAGAMPTPRCAVPVLGEGQECLGPDISSEEAATDPSVGLNQCCARCGKVPNCTVFTHTVSLDRWGEKTGAVCHFKHQCESKATALDNRIVNTGWAPPFTDVKSEVGYRVGRGVYDVHGYQCGDKSPKTVVFYPIGDGPLGDAAQLLFNVVVYGHGLWGYLDACDELLETIAGLGFIVIAPFTGGSFCPQEHEDMLLALRASRHGGGSLHPALARANFSRTGAFGVSMGAKGAARAGGQDGHDNHNIMAVLLMHGARGAGNLRVPAMFVTGTADTIETPSSMLRQYHLSVAYPKVFANLESAYHMEVTEGKRLNLFGGKFLSCHVAGRSHHCEAIYGKANGSLCKSNEYADCIVQVSESDEDSDVRKREASRGVHEQHNMRRGVHMAVAIRTPPDQSDREGTQTRRANAM